jgi:hypothetical protein
MMLPARGDFREKLKDELDQAYSVMSGHKKYSEGLDAAADQMEEFIGAEVASVIMQMLLSIEGDLTKLSDQLISWKRELELRRETREKRLDQMEKPQ